MRKLSDVLCDRCLYILETQGCITGGELCRRCEKSIARFVESKEKDPDSDDEQEKDLQD